ncbi:DgyrCDS7225 [Dimorphilus gyrociliatus]|uniref:DgyrCDS7225 n=1 Tax=Dimorphilus gyrociliatus TaxID=2664684 RepID=A0A7I8VQM1_9ANNE|nr:DgyrCDS7225 [Dimorphilus gyrociliatus]
MSENLFLTESIVEKILDASVDIPVAAYCLPKTGILNFCASADVSLEITNKAIKKFCSLAGNDYICSILNVNIKDYSMLIKYRKCFECCKKKLIWPLITKYLDCHKIDAVSGIFGDDHLSSLSYNTLIYCIENNYIDHFLHLWKWFLLQRNFEINNKVLAFLLARGVTDELKLIIVMLDWLKNKIRFSSHWRSKRRYDIQFYSERNVTWQHIEKFMELYGSIRDSNSEKLLFDCYKNGNSNVFFKLLDEKPDLKNYIPSNNEAFHLIETSEEIRDYFIQKNPYILQELHDYIMEISDENLYCGIWSVDFANLFKVQMLSDFFVEKQTLKKVYSLWLNKAWCASVYVVVPNTVQHQRKTVYDIVRFFNKHKMPLKKLGNQFCYRIFRAITEKMTNFIEEAYWVLPMLLQNGFVFTGKTPGSFELAALDENCRRLLKVLFLTSSQKCTFSSCLLDEIDLCSKPRTLVNLAVTTLRENRRENIENFISGLRLPQPMQSLILLEDVLQVLGVMSKIEIPESKDDLYTEHTENCLVKNIMVKDLAADYLKEVDVLNPIPVH